VLNVAITARQYEQQSTAGVETDASLLTATSTGMSPGWRAIAAGARIEMMERAVKNRIVSRSVRNMYGMTRGETGSEGCFGT
jgi:hypothetical protein